MRECQLFNLELAIKGSTAPIACLAFSAVEYVISRKNDDDEKVTPKSIGAYDWEIFVSELAVGSLARRSTELDYFGLFHINCKYIFISVFSEYTKFFCKVDFGVREDY
ncbi:hypothetical protein JTB14_037813 [Gonioctena quinquepunctata]|nr:hypothetical protein JTB14_037813 [Gonioctena quinquepunctata]